jgi:hypothetical protein
MRIDPYSSDISPTSDLQDTSPEPARIRLPAALGLALLPAFLAISSCCPGNDIRKIPTIRGRVVEAKTGKPIAGARLARWFEREDGCLAPGGSDIHRVPGSFLTVTSGQDGSFEWPLWNGLLSPIRSMEWYVYQPGWVAGKGWVTHPHPGLDGYFFGVDGAEPWVNLASRPVGSHLEVTITMQPTDNTAAWEAHFQRMVALTRYGELDVACFVSDAIACVSRQVLTRAMLVPLAELVSRLPSPGDTEVHQQRSVLAAAIATFCHTHSSTPECEWPIVSNVVRDLGQEPLRHTNPQ